MKTNAIFSLLTAALRTAALLTAGTSCNAVFTGEAHVLCSEQSDPPDPQEDGGDHDTGSQQL